MKTTTGTRPYILLLTIGSSPTRPGLAPRRPFVTRISADGSNGALATGRVKTSFLSDLDLTDPVPQLQVIASTRCSKRS